MYGQVCTYYNHSTVDLGYLYMLSLDRIDKNSSEPIYRQLEHLLLDSIENKEFSEGDRLPSESELVNQLGISRSTIRQALINLELRGAIFRQPGKGTFVLAQKIMWPGPSFFSFSKTFKPLGYVIKTKVLDFRLIEAPARVANDLNIPEKEAVVILKRLRHVSDIPMAITTSYTYSRFYTSMKNHDLENTPFNEVMENVTGLSIMNSKDSIEATIARTEEANLLNISIGDSLLFIRGVVFATDNTPLVSTNDLFRGDRFRIEVASDKAVALLGSMPK